MSASPVRVCPPPRIRQACNACRAKRARCLPTIASANICRRCHEKGIDCTFSNITRRNLIEREIDAPPIDLISPATTEAESENNPIANLGFPQESQTTIHDRPDHLQEVEANGEQHRSFLSRLFRPDSQTAYENKAVQPTARLAHLLGSQISGSARLTIRDSEIEQYLCRYDSLYNYFPFAPLPRGWSVQSMKEEHPFFLLGILSAMTVHDVPLNSQLHAQFLRTLSERVIVRGERNLDILQGTIAQLAWYPMHLNPQSRQIFQVLQIVVSMIQELDLAWLHADMSSSGDSASPNDYRLAYMACCYMSSLVAICFRRRNSLGWNESLNLTNLAMAPAMTHQYRSLCIHLSLQQLAELADNVRKGDYVDWTVKHLNNHFQDVLSTFPETAVNRSVPLTLTMHYVESQINACVFREQSDRPWSNGVDNQDAAFLALTRCLESTKGFLQTFLSLPMPEYRDLSFMQWAQLVQVLKVAPKLCFEDPGISQWDLEQVRADLRFELMIESLCYRMHELTSVGQLSSNRDEEWRDTWSTHSPASYADHFLMLKSVLKILKDEYDERCAAVAEDIWKRQRGSRCPVLNGSIKGSEYWDALQSRDEMPELFDFEGYNLNLDIAAEDWSWAAQAPTPFEFVDVGIPTSNS